MNADSNFGKMSIEPTRSAPPEPETADEIPIRHCENCGVSLGRVKNKRFCTSACRVSSHRKRNATLVSTD